MGAEIVGRFIASGRLHREASVSDASAHACQAASGFHRAAIYGPRKGSEGENRGTWVGHSPEFCLRC
jgi:hypothetical protein